MKILVINAGSSSLKYQLVDMGNESVVASGICDRIGIAGSYIKQKANGKVFEQKLEMKNHSDAIGHVLKALIDKEYGVICDMKEIFAVGHRIVHSAEDFTSSVIINENVLKISEKNGELAPLHNPANITSIRACQEVMQNTPMVAVFDTAFHSTMPQHAYLYGIPYEDYKNLRIRRYGFHGTSHMYVSQEAAKVMGKSYDNFKVVTCHLGNGSSITAVKNGKSIDTSMGFTPLEGVPMGTRSGSIDPAVVEFLMTKKNFTISEAITYLNKKSGMLGLSGFSSDFRDLTENSGWESEANRRAVEVFAYSVKKLIGAYAAAMNGLDCVVFTGGIGENTPIVRELVLSDMDNLGIIYDANLNNKFERGKIWKLTPSSSKVAAYIIPTNEELVIARETKRLINK